jgi:3-deoxy-D-manno-octulosonic-acid transferase
MAPPGYTIAVRLLSRLPLGRTKLAQSIAGRRQSVRRWLDWASRERTDAPLVWVHAASVGESLAVEPIVRRLRAAVPGIQVARSHSSPSAVPWVDSFAGDVHDFLPLDEPRSVKPVLGKVRPSLVMFSRSDLWPELVTQSVSLDIPVVVAGAIVRPTSKRLLAPVRALLRQLYQAVAWVGAVSQADAARWVRLGVPANRVSLTGDPRHDQILERNPSLSQLDHLADWRQQGAVILAGSTHRSDHRIVLDAFAALARQCPRARLMIVPHDPTPRRIAGIVRRGASIGTAIEVWDGGVAAPPDATCLVVARSGLLADLYALADVAYVGGGFDRGLLHAVCEPAAFAVPVSIGPRYHSSADAVLLLANHGAVAVPRESPVSALQRIWLDWICDETARITAGLKARGSLGRGAAAATVQQLLRYLDL